MLIIIDDILILKSGLTVKVDSMPVKDKYYCRTLVEKEFKVVMKDDIQYVHLSTPTLFPLH